MAITAVARTRTTLMVVVVAAVLALQTLALAMRCAELRKDGTFDSTGFDSC